MNPTAIVFKYSLIAYSESTKQNKNSQNKLNELEFFEEFKKSLLKNYLFIHSIIPNDELCLLFLNHSKSLCEFEALTFMSEDNLPLYKMTKANITNIIDSISTLLVKENHNFTTHFNDNDWRKLIAIANTFYEWTEDIKYFDDKNFDKINMLKESPLISLCNL